MRTIVLSDHTADKAVEAANQRMTHYQHALGQHQQVLADREKQKAARVRDMQLAWRHGEIGVVASSALGWLSTKFQKKPDAPAMQEAGNEEMKWRSGHHGEELVANHMAGLSDDWVLLKGFKNQYGEVDQLLVGPGGMFAFEIKYINGVVHCTADKWWFDKYDRHGNLVEAGRQIADRGGRHPGKQLDEPMMLLEALVGQNSPVECFTRVVVLAHPNSRVGTVDGLRYQGVDSVITLPDFTDGWMATYRQDLDQDDVALVVDLIHCMHEDYETKQDKAAERRKRAMH